MSVTDLQVFMALSHLFQKLFQDLVLPFQTGLERIPITKFGQALRLSPGRIEAKGNTINTTNRDLANRISTALPGVQVTGATGRKLKKIVNTAGVQIFAGQAAAHVQAEAMRNLSDLVDLARELAAGDPVKEQLLTEIVKTHAQSARARQTILGW